MTAQLQARELGDPFPPLVLPAVDGAGEIRIESFRGRRLLVFSWSSW